MPSSLILAAHKQLGKPVEKLEQIYKDAEDEASKKGLKDSNKYAYATKIFEKRTGYKPETKSVNEDGEAAGDTNGFSGFGLSDLGKTPTTGFRNKKTGKEQIVESINLKGNNKMSKAVNILNKMGLVNINESISIRDVESSKSALATKNKMAKNI